MKCKVRLLSRYPSGTLLPFLFGGLLIKTEQQEKGYPHCLGFTGEPSYRWFNFLIDTRAFHRYPGRTQQVK